MSSKLVNSKWAKFLVMGWMFTLIVGVDFSVYAADPKIYTGTRTMIQDVTKWLIILIPLAAACVIGWCKFQQMLSGNDPAVVASMNKWTKATLVSAVIGTTAAAIITWVLSYYR